MRWDRLAERQALGAVVLGIITAGDLTWYDTIIASQRSLLSRLSRWVLRITECRHT